MHIALTHTEINPLSKHPLTQAIICLLSRSDMEVGQGRLVCPALLMHLWVNNVVSQEQPWLRFCSIWYTESLHPSLLMSFVQYTSKDLDENIEEPKAKMHLLQYAISIPRCLFYLFFSRNASSVLSITVWFFSWSSIFSSGNLAKYQPTWGAGKPA